MRKYIWLIPLLLTSCTYTITQVQTKGVATDVVDDTDTPDVDASLSVPASVLP
jgi:hypothetical protein